MGASPQPFESIASPMKAFHHSQGHQNVHPATFEGTTRPVYGAIWDLAHIAGLPRRFRQLRRDCECRRANVTSQSIVSKFPSAFQHSSSSYYIVMLAKLEVTGHLVASDFRVPQKGSRSSHDFRARSNGRPVPKSIQICPPGLSVSLVS